MTIPPTMYHSQAKRRLLAKYIHGNISPDSNPGWIIPHRPAEAPAPVSLSQEQLLLRELSISGIPPLYNECISIRMKGSVEPTVLECSLTAIVRRHETWRTSYAMKNGRLVQIVSPAPLETRLPILDLHRLPAAAREIEAERHVSELVSRPFDLEHGPLWRAILIKLTEFDQRLFMAAHLSIVDGISVYKLLPSELAALYRYPFDDKASGLPELPIQFGDYAYWQRQWMQGPEFASQIEHWRKRLAGAPELQLPVDHSRPVDQTYRGAICKSQLTAEVSSNLKTLCREEGVTLFILLLASFVTLLHRYTQQEDIIVGTPSPSGRKHLETEKLLGYFLNPVALRFDFTGNPSFRELLRQAQELTLEAIENDDVPIELLAQELKLAPDPSRNPLLMAAISLQPSTPFVGFDWSVTSMDISSGGAPWDLYIAFIDAQAGITARAQYNPGLFDASTIEQLLRDLGDLLKSLCSSPQQLSETETSS